MFKIYYRKLFFKNVQLTKREDENFWDWNVVLIIVIFKLKLNIRCNL